MRATNWSAGSARDQNVAIEFLQRNTIYTLNAIRSHNGGEQVELKEFPSVWFNYSTFQETSHEA